MPDPILSVVIPTLNAERHLASCLPSLRKQRFDPAAIEILVADGGSTDRTVQIAREHGCRILDAKGLMAEAAKRLAFSMSSGEYLCLLDADNEIASDGWLAQAMASLRNHPEAMGFESYYVRHPAHSMLNAYLTECLQISDPYARFLSSTPKRLRRDPDGTEMYELPADGAYPTGANGFLFPRRLLAELGPDEGYHEAVFFPRLMRAGGAILLKHPACGVHHHYVTTWGDYYRKRQRAMIIYMLRKEETSAAWDQDRRTWRSAAALLFFGTMIGPALAGVGRALATGKLPWILHPLAGLYSTVGNLVGVLRYRREADRKKRIALTQRLHTRKDP